MKKFRFSALLGVGLLVLAGCGEKTVKYKDYIDDNYRNYYHIFVNSYADSNRDGIGDLNGITANLDYLRDKNDPHKSTSLGINGIFLSPIHPSPSYHKYDITDFFSIDPQFGTMKDFERFIKAAHERGIRVILDGVFNHISAQHPIFEETIAKLKQNPICYENFNSDGSLASACYDAVPEARRFRFVQAGLSTMPGNYSNRIQNFNLGSLSKSLSYEGFASGMVDLDLDHPDNRQLVKEYLEFWLDKGVDGFRLDAIQSYYGEVRIDFDKNAEFINFIDQTVKAKKKDAYVIAEGPWNYAIRNYQSATSIESYFNFDSSFQGMSSLVSDDLVNYELNADHFYNYFKGLEDYFPDSPDAINANFLSNHDIGRITSSFYRYDKGGIDIEQQKLYYGLMNLVKGCFYFYYGDEIGMYGRKGGVDDDRANRASFIWGDEKYRTAEMIAGETEKTLRFYEDQGKQILDPNSLFSYCSNLTRIKDSNPEIARGVTSRIEESDSSLLLLEKTYGERKIYVAVNLGEQAKVLSIDRLKKEGRLIDSLDVGATKAHLSDGQLELPRYSIAFIK